MRGVLVALAIWSVSEAAVAGAQVAGLMTGAIVGTVSDATGAVLPDVSVIVLGDALIGAPRTVTTNSAGFYRLPALSPGLYSVRFARGGFEGDDRGSAHGRLLLEEHLDLPELDAMAADLHLEIVAAPVLE